MSDRLNINMRVDDVPYSITATPCTYNSEIQYKVSVNGNDEVIFVFDPAVGRYVAAGNDSVSVPDDVEMEIGNRLNSDSLKIQKNH